MAGSRKGLPYSITGDGRACRMPGAFRLAYAAVAAAMISLLIPADLQSEEAMVYIHSAPRSPTDHSLDFHWEILKTALEKTRDKYGLYRIETVEHMSEPRQARELTETSGRLTVALLGTTPEFERDLLAIHIPVDKNLSGLFVFLTREKNGLNLLAARSVASPGGFSIGLSSRSMVNAVFMHNGFKRVSLAASREGLYEMLANGRFDALPVSVADYAADRGLIEKVQPALAVEGTVLLSCVWPVYFWFPKTPGGRALARRAGEGMWRMIEDGTYGNIFDKHFLGGIESLNLGRRKILPMDNPLAGPETPIKDRALWLEPETVRDDR